MACEMVKLIKSTTATIFIVDLASLVNGWNEKTAELIRSKANKAIGKSLVKEIIHEDSREVVGNLLAKPLHGNTFCIFTKCIIHTPVHWHKTIITH